MKTKKQNIKFLFYIWMIISFTVNEALAKESYIISSVAIVGMSMDYKEYSKSGELLDSEESSYSELTGAEMSIGSIFNIYKNSYSKVKLNLLLLSGNTKYKGSYLGSGDSYGSVVSKTVNTIVDTDISFSHTNILNKIFEINYGFGFGYREWERGLSVSQIEVYKWYYYQYILGISTMATKKLKLGIAVEYQQAINPIMTSSSPKLDFTLGGVDIWELSIPISYKYNEILDVYIEATFSKQTIVESDVEYSGGTGYYEPKSTAYNNYLKFGLSFKF